MFALNTWSEYPLTDICFVEYGNKFDLNKMDVSDGAEIAFISRTACNNGISAWVNRVDAIQPYPKGRITIALGGSIGETFLQDQAFYTGQNVAVLSTKENISREAKLFLISVIKAECSLRFVAFGRELNKHIKKDFKVSLPSKTDGTPDWQYMENYIRTLEERKDESGRTVLKALHSKNASRCERVETKDWKEFELGEVFDQMYKAEAHVKSDMLFAANKSCDALEFVSRTEDNNGCDCIVSKEGLVGVEKGNAIIIGDTTATMFYQGNDFVAGDHIVVCRSDWMNKYRALFLISVVARNKYRYCYGRAFKMDLIKATKIRLPATTLGDPDWAYMEKYIRSLPYGDRI